jgi:beta-phosphoglucomutase-like phosphatase (HAD superfamily)
MPLAFSTVIFDMDGTLFGTERLAIDALQGAFGEHGVAMPYADLEAVIGKGGEGRHASPGATGGGDGYVDDDGVLNGRAGEG